MGCWSARARSASSVGDALVGGVGCARAAERSSATTTACKDGAFDGVPTCTRSGFLAAGADSVHDEVSPFGDTPSDGSPLEFGVVAERDIAREI